MTRKLPRIMKRGLTVVNGDLAILSNIGVLNRNIVKCLQEVFRKKFKAEGRNHLPADTT